MKKTVFLAFAALVIACAPKPEHHLTILHVNDTHSHFETIRSGSQDGTGGLIEIAAYVDSVRKADGAENVLLLHAGDYCQGTAYFSELKGSMEIKSLEILGFDAVTLGNHEFDNGIEGLEQMIPQIKPQVVACNLDFSPFSFGKNIKPYVIVEKAGLKIGVIGVVTRLHGVVSAEVADRIPEFDMVETVQKYADELRPQCDLVVVLSHIGYDEHNEGDVTDPILAASTRGIDIFVGGHSHTFLEEPDWVTNLDGKKVPIVQAGCWGTYMGEFHVDM